MLSPTSAQRRPTSGTPRTTSGVGRNCPDPQNPQPMRTRPHIPPRHASSAGFTLVELMVTIMVLAVLSAIAYPSFVSAIRKSRRADAVAALSSVQQAQERWRNNNPAYADNAKLTLPVNPAPPAQAGLGQSATSSSSYYSIEITSASAAAYRLTAHAVSGTQVDDGDCKYLGIDVVGGNIQYGSGAGAVVYPDAHNCWAR
jgi:type IV pilus assembly protein PilE